MANYLLYTLNKRGILVLLLISLLNISLSANEKLKTYGFMDFGFQPWQSLKRNTPLWTYLNENMEFQMQGINIYWDFTPNPYSRAMIETSYRANSIVTLTEPDSKVLAIERAWVEGVFNDKFKFRGGKFITPAGIWNVDHGSPVITSILTPIQTSWFPIFPKSQLGSMIHGVFFTGNHDLVYNIYATSGNHVNNHIRKIEDIAWGGHLELKMDYFQQLDFGISARTAMGRKEILDVQIVNPSGTPLESQNIWYDNKDTLNMRDLVYGAQFKGQIKGVGLQAEVNFRHAYNTLDHWNRTDIWAYYLLGSYDQKLTDHLVLKPYYLFEVIEWRNDHYNRNLELVFLPLEGWIAQTFGLNLGIFSNMHVKAEFNLVTPFPQNSSSFNGEEISNNYTTDDLIVYRFNTQFSMAF